MFDRAYNCCPLELFFQKGYRNKVSYPYKPQYKDPDFMRNIYFSNSLPNQVENVEGETFSTGQHRARVDKAVNIHNSKISIIFLPPNPFIHM